MGIMKIPPITKRRALARKYRRAARLIDIGQTDLCCVALDRIPASSDEFEAIFMADAMKSTGKASCGMWMHGLNEHSWVPEVRERRIFALLWAAELIEDGEAYRIMRQKS
jgi:hypothetical protein